MEQLINEIKTNGVKETIKYVEENGIKYVVDGNHRLAISKFLNIDKVPVEKVSLPYKGFKTPADLRGN